ncbi:hypothetical protein BDF20DRAFT_470108 [Mycotypha africana]|uniref:uncharacterized protein n=1 Tax=Mycotypha africana TaxID=64632 RepID=UPI0023017B2A|nr:uncharacterized protein BDF20DRAFT_470108 [Mycotypha africana]KAI8982419.1 hypothetical protein BDF20DRAFT_470108 [Mycotypha africana]
MVSSMTDLCLAKPIDPSQPFATDEIDYDLEYLRFGTEAVAESVRRMLDGARRQYHPFFSEPLNSTGEDLEKFYEAEARKVLERTFALSIGRALYAYATYEVEHFKLPIEPINLQVHFEKMDIKTNINVDISREDISWPDFHTGVSAGLRMSPQSRITAEWIGRFLPDKPEPKEAGALLAFGLNGFLDRLTDADQQRLFAQKDAYVTIALLLGLAVTNVGTRKEEVHTMMGAFIPSILPEDTPEFMYKTLTVQAAATLGIGLVFMNSFHIGRCHNMLLEMERMGKADPQHLQKDYETCCLAAGFALGLMTLGKGDAAINMRRDFQDRLYKLVCRTCWTAGDNAIVNMTATSPAATYALALMYLKTESKVIADSIPLPHTAAMIDHMPVDFLVHRVIAKNIIMWSNIQPTKAWVQGNIPNYMADNQVAEKEAVVQAMYYIICGACQCIGLKYAGTRDETAFQCLLDYLDYFMTLSVPLTTKQKEVTKTVIRNCINVLCTATAMVMAGTGNLTLLDRLKKLYQRINDVNYGDNMAVSMALGLLYMGLGSYTLKTTSEAVAGLLIAFYPFYPTSTRDNRYHLQAFRHLWILAKDRRWITTFDTVRNRVCKVPLIVETVEDQSGNTKKRRVEAPAVFETFDNVKSIKVTGDRYDPLYVDMTEKNGKIQKTIMETGTLYVQLRPGQMSYEEDPQGRKGFRFFTKKEISRLKSSA